MYIFETDRLLFRRLTHDDRETVASALKDERVMTPMHLPVSEEFIDEWLERMLCLYETSGAANWYVERREDGLFVGIMGVVVSETDSATIAELGYFVQPSLQRQGYALEGVRACMDYAFSQLYADYVTALIPEDNLPSVRLAERLELQPVQQLLYAHGDETVTYILYAARNPG